MTTQHCRNRRLCPRATPFIWLGLFLAAGCATPAPPPKLVNPLAANSFAQSWYIKLPLEAGDSVDRLFDLADHDLLIAYTKRNRAFGLSLGGSVLFSAQITPPGAPLRPPLVANDRIIFPTSDSLEIYSRDGSLISSRQLGHSTGGNATYEKDVVYVGLDYPTGERLSAINITREYGQLEWEVLIRGALYGAPAVFQNEIYAGSQDGRVWAVSADGKGLWPDPGFVQTGGVVADVKADETGVYAASLDTELYCFNRSDGQIKWRYFATIPLRDPPVLTHDTVYQHVPQRGLVALDKLTSKGLATPKWICSAAQQWLAQDPQFIYAADSRHGLIAVDKTDGRVVFRSRGGDFAAFASNTKDSMLYVATASGTIRAVRPILRPGEVGIIVMNRPDARDALAALP